MKQSEERALEKYPPLIVAEQLVPNATVVEFNPKRTDLNAYQRAKFQEGYEQAEKDLALTINDLELLHTFLYAVKNNKQGVFTFTRLTDEQYQRVLDRFNKKEDEK